jgi:hypothetical protein
MVLDLFVTIMFTAYVHRGSGWVYIDLTSERCVHPLAIDSKKIIKLNGSCWFLICLHNHNHSRNHYCRSFRCRDRTGHGSGYGRRSCGVFDCVHCHHHRSIRRHCLDCHCPHTFGHGRFRLWCQYHICAIDRQIIVLSNTVVRF